LRAYHNLVISQFTPNYQYKSSTWFSYIQVWAAIWWATAVQIPLVFRILLYLTSINKPNRRQNQILNDHLKFIFIYLLLEIFESIEWCNFISGFVGFVKQHIDSIDGTGLFKMFIESVIDSLSSIQLSSCFKRMWIHVTIWSNVVYDI
jgi:hypothetical protein